MKKHFYIAVLLLSVCYGAKCQQVFANENSLSASVDGKDFTTQPRKIRIGTYNWITANAAKPDRSLRFWFFDPAHSDKIPDVGKYLLIDEKDNSDKVVEKVLKEGNFVGFVVVKYVEETKTPRMEYHVGESYSKAKGSMEVTSNKNGILEGNFTFELDGSWWKERASATVFGGMGRLVDKAKDKAKTNATGFDQDIDPEGNGYRRQDKKDTITISAGKFKLKY
jgi:hypothetical protein